MDVPEPALPVDRIVDLVILIQDLQYDDKLSKALAPIFCDGSPPRVTIGRLSAIAVVALLYKRLPQDRGSTSLKDRTSTTRHECATTVFSLRSRFSLN